MAYVMTDSLTLDALYKRVKQPTKKFYLNWFKRQINFTTKEIMFERVFGDDRRLAPFVVPTMQGRPQRLEGSGAVSFTPAYVKVNDIIDPGMTLERLPGEAPFGNLTPEQRWDAIKAELLRKQGVIFDNRNEWLAARALIDGQVTIAGEDYPSRVVNFRRDPSLTITLAGGARWDQSTGDPLASLKSARMAANGLSGARIRTHVFGATAWELFNDRVDVRELMNKNYGGNNTNVTLMADGWSDQGQEYMGTIQGLNGAGAIDVWVDTSKYVDDTGAEQFYLDQTSVLGISDMVEGVRCFGAIMDKRAGLQAREYFFKNYEEENPSVERLLGQSAPLMVPKVPNATFLQKVA